MKLKILSILTAVILILGQLPAFAAAPTVAITAPRSSETLQSDSVVLSVTSSDADEVRFYLDNLEIAKFSGSGDFEHVIEEPSYGSHTFKAVAIARGANVRQTQVTFFVRDYNDFEVKNLDCNSFDGVSISTAGFSGFQQNIDTTGNPNGKLGLGKGPDGSSCVMLQGAKKNNTNLYLPFINFALPSTNKDTYVFEHDVLVSDEGMRLGYEASGMTNVIMKSAVDSYTLEPGKWYKLKTEFDFNAGTYDVYVDGELKLSGSGSQLTKTEVRICWASTESEDGYVLIDNFVVIRKVATPIVGKMEYLKNGEWSTFTSEIPLGTEQIKFYPDTSMTPAPKDTLSFYQNGEAIEADFEFTSDGALAVTPRQELLPKANCVVQYNSGALGGCLSAYFTVGGDVVSAMSVTFNAGKYQAQYRSQLTDGASVSTRAIISNAAADPQPILVITAVYSGNTMTACAAAQGTANANGIGIVNVPAVSADSGSQIVCYVVDSWENRIPLVVAGQLLE